MPDVVGVGNVPVDRVGRATELLLDERPFEGRPALAAVFGLMQTADQAGLNRFRLDEVDRILGQAAMAALGLLLERKEHVLDEAPRALLDVTLALGELERSVLGDQFRCRACASVGRTCLHRSDTLT